MIDSKLQSLTLEPPGLIFNIYKKLVPEINDTMDLISDTMYGVQDTAYRLACVCDCM